MIGAELSSQMSLRSTAFVQMGCLGVGCMTLNNFISNCFSDSETRWQRDYDLGKYVHPWIENSVQC